MAISYNVWGDHPSSPPGYNGLCSVQARSYGQGSAHEDGDASTRVEDARLPCTASASQRMPSQSGLGARCQFWYAFRDGVVLLVYAHGASPCAYTATRPLCEDDGYAC